MVAGWDLDTISALLWKQSGTGTCPNDWEVIDLSLTASKDCWTILQAHDVNNSGWVVAIAERLNDGGVFPVSTDFPDRRVVLIREFNECAADSTDFSGADGCPDGEVNVFDLLMVLNNWGTAGPDGDITDALGGGPDGVVNLFDLLMVLQQWGTCDIGGGTMIQTEQDCFNKFYPDHMEALNSCLEAVAATQ